MRFSTLTRTRRGRVLLATVPTVAALALLGGGVAQGAVPVSFAVSGSQFKISASSLEGTGFSQYAGIASQVGSQFPKAIDPKLDHPIAIANIREATLHDLCQSIKVPVPVIGAVSMLIRAGEDADNPVTAKDLQIGMENLAGDASFGKIRIGVDATTARTAPAPAQTSLGDFAMDADTVTITGLQQVSRSTQAETFNLNGLDLSINMSGQECF